MTLAVARMESTTGDGRGKPRLMIKEMVLDNFKSYAGAQRVGPFHKVRAHPALSLGQSAVHNTYYRHAANQLCSAVLLIGGGAQRQRQVQRH